MDPAAIVTLIGSIISVGMQAVQAGKDAAPYIKLIYDDITGKAPSEVDQQDVEAKLAALSADIQRPLDPEMPGEL